MHSRRSFLHQSAAITSGFLGLDHFLSSDLRADNNFSYGELVEDPKGLLDLPRGFQYEVLSRTGDKMSDGFRVPGQPDGMATFDLGNGKMALIRNHEIGHSGFTMGPFEDNSILPEGIAAEQVYDAGRFGAQPFVGGTTTLVYDLKSRKTTSQFLSLLGTDRNCAGGPTPWNSWITCEEPADMTSQWGAFHGYAFEVPASAKPLLADPIPLKEMGRFRHEAVAVDPKTGIVYLTEDRPDGAIYRFLPKAPGKLYEGGKLQALKILEEGMDDTRNWPGGKSSFPLRQRVPVAWVDLEEVTSPKDDLRLQAASKGTTIFSRAEGMWFGSEAQVGESSIYWACTDGGAKLLGQIFRYFPSPHEGTPEEKSAPGELELFLEPNNTELLRNGDNITVSPRGHLYICEDTSGANHLRGVTKKGEMFTFARNRISEGELTGVCFSPDGSTLFVNIQSPGVTFAVTGSFG